jgi:hypothetical protein
VGKTLYKGPGIPGRRLGAGLLARRPKDQRELSGLVHIADRQIDDIVEFQLGFGGALRWMEATSTTAEQVTAGQQLRNVTGPADAVDKRRRVQALRARAYPIGHRSTRGHQLTLQFLEVPHRVSGLYPESGNAARVLGHDPRPSRWLARMFMVAGGVGRGRTAATCTRRHCCALTKLDDLTLGVSAGYSD